MRAERLLTGGPWFAILGLALLPALFGVGPMIEARLFPVVTRAEIIDPHPIGGGVAFYVRFEKLRRCEYLGLHWYQGGRRIPIDFEPDAGRFPRSRPIGEQEIGPWFAEGVPSLDGTRAIVQHRCHPLWLTETTLHQ